MLGLLRQDYAATGRADVFDRLKVVLSQDRGAVRTADLAAQLGTTEGAIKVAVHRLRRRYRELLREEISHTVATPEEIEGEIRHLFAAFGQ